MKQIIIFTIFLILLLTAVDFVLAGTATLSWNANTEPDLAGYKIYYGTSKRTGDCPDGGYHEKIDTGKTDTPSKPSYKIENLKEGKTYYFSVTSYDTSDNESCFSGEMSKTFPKLNWRQAIDRFFLDIFNSVSDFLRRVF